jgi:anti-sigma factor RsiW
VKCAEIHPNLAAFALDGLESEEAAEVRRHLASCPGCRGELEELRPTGAQLTQRKPGEVLQRRLTVGRMSLGVPRPGRRPLRSRPCSRSGRSSRNARRPPRRGRLP